MLAVSNLDIEARQSMMAYSLSGVNNWCRIIGAVLPVPDSKRKSVVRTLSQLNGLAPDGVMGFDV